MNEEINRHYIHYLRLGAISGAAAQWLLANFELMTRDISDQDEYEVLFKHESKLAYKVISAGLDSGALKYTCEVNPIEYDSDGNVHYWLDPVKINVTDFCSWASDLSYTIPDIFAKYINDTARKEVVAFQEVDICNRATTPTKQDSSNKGGRPKGFLVEVVEYLFEHFKQNEPGMLAPGKIRSFIIRMKEMASKKSRYADEYVMARIKFIETPDEGMYTIMTEDEVRTKGQNELVIRGAPYTKNDVAKHLSVLRKNNLKTA